MAERVEFAFLRAELRTGLTTAKISATAKGEAKKRRNREMSRKAYDTALHFLAKSNVTDSELAELRPQVEELRKALRELGEDV